MILQLLIEWVLKQKNAVVPFGLLLSSIVTLTINAYQGRDRPPSFFARATLSAVGFFQGTVAGADHGLADLWERYAELRGAKTDNERLGKRVKRLESEVLELRGELGKYQKIMRIPGIQDSAPTAGELIVAEVIGWPLPGGARIATLDKGLEDGVIVQMAVLTIDDRVVGQVVDNPIAKIGYHCAQVLLITDQRSRVPVLILNPERDAPVRGVLAGRPETDDGLLLYVMRNDVNLGDPIVTSGEGGVFKKGLLIGVVADLPPDDGAKEYPEIVVKPEVDFKRLDEFLVVRKYELLQ